MKDKRTTNMNQGLISIKKDQNKCIICETNEEKQAENLNLGFWAAVCACSQDDVHVGFIPKTLATNTTKQTIE